MTRLFKRASIVTVDTIEIAFGGDAASLDVSFEVQRNLKPEPDTASVEIWNLNADHRSQLEETTTSAQANRRVPVSIEAGYEGGTALLFLGTMRTAFTTRQGADLVTMLETGDSEKEYQRSRIGLSLAPKTPNPSVLQQITRALGIKEGNLSTATPKLLAAPLLFPQGGVLSGSASQIMTRVTQSLGFEWSIQEGSLQLLELGTPLATTATRLTSDTGLVGSPSIDNEGILTCQTLMIPDIFPGRLLVLESERLSGNYRVEQCKYSGATHGTNWYIDIEAKKLG